MTVEEILKREKQYKENHKNVHLVPNEVGELVPYNINDDISFLTDGKISKHYHPNGAITAALKNKGLNDFEILMLNCFLGDVSHVFKWHSYEGSNSPIPDMCEGLDHVLNKSPIYDEGRVLYRFCTTDDKIDFKEGEIFHAPHYITTTKDDWKHKTNVYVITPKKEGTNARSLYKLCNHGNENQVTFKRGTRFKITKVEGKKRKRVYMEEL
ncbi:MAG: hypothetical protein K5899_00305 [Bacteroidaceae bacterium]|nr:hypothetical protein [Bacteroidaceae bacterium]